MVLVFYYKGILGNKVMMQRIQQFPDFSLLPRETQLIVAHAMQAKIAMNAGIALSEIRLFLENHSLEFHDVWHDNTIGNKQLEH